MTEEIPVAIGLVRIDIPAPNVDLYALAAQHGYRLTFTINMSASPILTMHALARHAGEWGAEAVVVPGFEHAEAVRAFITPSAALITPMQLYPRGYRWPADVIDRMEDACRSL